MFEKEAEDNKPPYAYCALNTKCELWKDGFQKGAEFGYNKANEDVKHDLMMKLKDEGIVKVLKDSIFCNKKLSSQEQQELCAWVECAVDFGENLDECAKELEEANKANEWHYVKNGDLPPLNTNVLVIHRWATTPEVGKRIKVFINSSVWVWAMCSDRYRYTSDDENVIAWKEIVLPKESE